MWGKSNNKKLLFKTLDQAINQLNGERPFIHSDRSRIDMPHCMSRVGKCINNGPMETFWGTPKCEKYYLQKYETFDELEKQ